METKDSIKTVQLVEGKLHRDLGLPNATYAAYREHLGQGT